jgi:hypothetical protein
VQIETREAAGQPQTLTARTFFELDAAAPVFFEENTTEFLHTSSVLLSTDDFSSQLPMACASL